MKKFIFGVSLFLVAASTYSMHHKEVAFLRVRQKESERYALLGGFYILGRCDSKARQKISSPSCENLKKHLEASKAILNFCDEEMVKKQEAQRRALRKSYFQKECPQNGQYTLTQKIFSSAWVNECQALNEQLEVSKKILNSYDEQIKRLKNGQN